LDTSDAAHLSGLKPVLELLRDAPGRIDSVFLRKGLRSPESLEIQDLCRKNSIHYTLVEAAGLSRLLKAGRGGPQVNHQGVVARLSSCKPCTLEELLGQAKEAPLQVIVALDQVKDPGNAGTLARTMYALGAAGLLLPEHNSAYLGPAALRSSAGALERLAVVKTVNLGHALDRAEEEGFTIYGTGRGTSESPALNPFSTGLQLPAVIVLGSEEKGLRPGVAKRCSKWLEIPFRRAFDSLNVAQAGAILLAMAAAHDSH
jgi:23S rRNA (guanosine2251-2'-O)-methyltransferase